jgi:hypothetical protein
VENNLMPRKTNNYIDNEVFFKEMCEWKTLVNEAEETGDPRPPCSNYIGECFVKIAEHLSFKPNNLLCLHTKNRKREKTKLHQI